MKKEIKLFNDFIERYENTWLNLSLPHFDTTETLKISLKHRVCHQGGYTTHHFFKDYCHNISSYFILSLKDSFGIIKPGNVKNQDSFLNYNNMIYNEILSTTEQYYNEMLVAEGTNIELAIKHKTEIMEIINESKHRINRLIKMTISDHNHNSSNKTNKLIKEVMSMFFPKIVKLMFGI